MPLFGYGAKSFMLSMIETVLQLTDGQSTGQEIQHMLDHGKRLLDFPIELLPHVPEALAAVKAQGLPLMLLTKGDLFDQESKLARSGLGDLFDHVEIVSEKNETTYQRILNRHNVQPEEFVMVGNSLKSDVLPVARLGGRAIYVPYHTTWVMERVAEAEQAGVYLPRNGLPGRGADLATGAGVRLAGFAQQVHHAIGTEAAHLHYLPPIFGGRVQALRYPVGEGLGVVSG